jgi:divalent metal cation (Fe/Co/Zn/Cd) transporter
LLVAAYEISSAIIQRFTEGAAPQITPLSFWLVMATFPVNLLVVVLEKRAGQRLQSEILLADAKHTQTDLYVTISVLGSLIGVRLGWAWLDFLIAAGVVLLIVRAAFEILSDTSRWLTDIAVVDPELVEEIAANAPGVRFVHRIRSRGTPNAAFVDLHVKVDPGMSTSQAHAIATEIERRLVEKLVGVSDALVHIEPAKKVRPSQWEQMNTDLRSIADGLGLGVHDLHIHTSQEGVYTIEVHLEMHGNPTLGEAHHQADLFEEQVKRRWPQAEQVITHLEPITESVLLPGKTPDPAHEELIRTLLAQHLDDDQLLDLALFYSGERLHAALKICLSPGSPLTEVHSFTEHIETDLLKQVPALYRVTLHVEPKLSRKGNP